MAEPVLGDEAGIGSKRHPQFDMLSGCREGCRVFYLKSCPQCAYPVLAHYERCLHCSEALTPEPEARTLWEGLPQAEKERAEDELLRRHNELNADVKPRLWLRHMTFGFAAAALPSLIHGSFYPEDLGKLLLCSLVTGSLAGLALHRMHGGPYKGAFLFAFLYFAWGGAAMAWDLPFPGLLHMGVFMFPCLGMVLGIMVERAFRQDFGA